MTVPTEAQKTRATQWFEALRDQVSAAFEALEDALTGPGSDRPPGRFERKSWERRGEGGGSGGGGVMSIMYGRVFEKVGVNVSTVFGELKEEFRGDIPGTAEDPRFWAGGISLVAHPRSPLVPAVHMNTRHITTTTAWFGGGMDLTPTFADEDDTRDFHEALKAACDAHDPDYHPRFKKWCDEYFYLPHRGETRGVGGLFFDDLNEWDFDTSFAFMRSVGDNYLQAYAPIVERRRNHEYGERERQFQLYRRGRYVEFNLVYDRGTLFGLESGGRTESILMSLPPLVRWAYDWKPDPGSAELDLYENYLRPRDWLGESADD